MIQITSADTATVDATFVDDWVVETEEVVFIAGPGIDASGTALGRTFLIKGELSSGSGPAITIGETGQASSETTLTVDYRGTLLSAGAGVVGQSGGVSVEVKGDINQAGLIRATGIAVDFSQGANLLSNDGTIRSTGATAVRTSGYMDEIVNTGTIEADQHAIVVSGDGVEITNHGTLIATRGSAISSTGNGLTVLNTNTMTARKDAISVTGADAVIENNETITSTKGAGISISGAGASILNTTSIKAATFGIVATGVAAEITNAGQIVATGIGIKATGAGSVIDTTALLKANVALVLAGDGTIATNSNEIRATSKTEAAVQMTGNSDFTNTGTLYTKSGHAILAAGGENSIVNIGSIYGDVKLGGGNDFFSSLMGEVTGKVYGGKGHDVYEVGTKIKIVEKAGQGIDTVQSVYSWKLGANIENLELIGEEAADARGNKLNNILTGNAADNRFWGFAGRDVFVMQTDGATDQIMDFQDGRDLIDFRDVDGINRYADIKDHISQSGKKVVIELMDEAGMTLVIHNTSLSDINARDFLF
jgi:hypothetical protein